MTFQVSFNSFGETVCENLVADGENIPVTQENKVEYIDKVVHWRFVKRVEVYNQMEACKFLILTSINRNKWP